MTNQPGKHGGVLHVLLAAALLAAAWVAFLKFTGAHASLGESNFQSNIIRADDYFYGSEKTAALIGTSITGRLLPEYFGEQGVAVANLGLDSCIPRTGIELVLKKQKLPPVIFVETTAPVHEQRENDMEILGFLQGITFRLGAYIPLLRADTRPSSILYSRMKQKNDARNRANTIPEPPALGKKRGGDPVYALLSAEEQAAIAGREAEKLQHALAALSARGVRVVLMRLPVGDQPTRSQDAAPDLTDRLAAELSLKVVDVASILRERGIPIAFSDGTHMVAPSAREASRVICEWLKESR